MQIILLEKVANLGNLGDVVKVKDGYARNFLIPTRVARRATESAIKEFEVKRAELEKAAAEKLAVANALGEKMSGRTVHITQKAGCRRPAVRLGDERRYCRRADPDRLQGRQVASAPAQRAAEDCRRAHRERVAPHRCRRRSQGRGSGRNRLTHCVAAAGRDH